MRIKLLKVFITLVVLGLAVWFSYFLATQFAPDTRATFIATSEIIDPNKFTCKGTLGTSLYAGNKEGFSSSWLEGTTFDDTTKLTFEITIDEKGNKILNFMTSTGVEYGYMDPTPLVVVNDEGGILTAVGFEEPGAGNFITHTIVINRNNGTGVWTKVNDSFITPYPYNISIYLQCL